MVGLSQLSITPLTFFLANRLRYPAAVHLGQEGDEGIGWVTITRIAWPGDP